ncbi:MAG: tRNA (cytidine(34)-2'-O)-methyltransferase [Planctomycetota bacterium]
MFHIVLHEPEIPNNTGNIGRTCVALGMSMRLIHPIGFDLDDHSVRRAGLDYWPRLDLTEHANWPAYETGSPGARRWLLTTRTDRTLYDADLRPGDHLVFGKESAGLPAHLVDRADSAPGWSAACLPMRSGERSLNLATAVAVVAYEGVRQCLARGDASLDGAGRLLP